MALPNFLNIGTMKGGTTSLFYYLEAHPDVYMPKAKELHFFVAERNWSRGLAWYEAQFEDSGDASVVGEASPSYSNFPQWKGVPGRIADNLPNARLIYVMRDPLERMKSHYRHEVIMGREAHPPDEALTTDTSYFFRSCYALQLEQYLEHFSPSQILLITSEELREDRSKTMSKVYKFLSLRQMPDGPESEFHRSDEKRRRGRLGKAIKAVPGYQKIAGIVPERIKSRLGGLAYQSVDTPGTELSPKREEELRAALAPDVERLSKMMGTEFKGWGFLSPP